MKQTDVNRLMLALLDEQAATREFFRRYPDLLKEFAQIKADLEDKRAA